MPQEEIITCGKSYTLEKQASPAAKYPDGVCFS
jgi:hypothetical protein